MRHTTLPGILGRDHRAVDALRAVHWRQWHLTVGAMAALELADRLRLHAAALQAGWPDQAERDSDLASHVRLAEKLRRAGSVAGR